jgi:hypothetical protein
MCSSNCSASSSIVHENVQTDKCCVSPLWLSLVHLNFEENALTGTLPTELGMLQYLKFLVVPLNRISGPIPSELSQMPLLTELALNNNDLSGTLPEELGILENLAAVFLFGNPRLTGTVPDSYGNMAKLGTWCVVQVQYSLSIRDHVKWSQTN